MKVVLVLLLGILAVDAAGTLYTNVARSYPTHAVETVPATVQTVQTTASVVPVPQGNPSSQYHAQDSSGQYSYGYVTADGQSKVENKAVDGTVSGQYSYFDPEGKKVELSYIADKDGFRASGNHLPVAPEVPDLPDDLEDAYEEATGRLATASFKTLATSPQTYSYNVQPASYVNYPATPYTRGYQYYTNTYPGYVQRYTYGTPSVTGYQRPSTGYQYYTTSGFPTAYQSYATSGFPTAYQSYTARRPTGFQYYTTYPTTYAYTAPASNYATPTRYTYSPSTGAIRHTYSPTRYTYSPTRYSYTPTGYTGRKSGYSSHAYSY